ncbi:MAG: DUF1232 domain-containing protein [Burkholderiales bacterium]|nr:DUF1232 domain-containing protein [Burkholderiales bacterium]
MTYLERFKGWVHCLKRDVMAVYFAARDKRTPFYVRVLALAVAAYALSPVDLIPDFIPVVGYLDDWVVVPLGVLLVVRLLPPGVLITSREKANALIARPKSYIAALFIGGVWVCSMTGATYWWLYR